MRDALNAALSAEDFSRLMAGFGSLSAPVAVAVSGGADSMALAFCLARWAQRPLIALIVEHGMRPESPTEAAEVKDRLEALGIKAEILPWRHEPLKGRVHEKARDARYRLLFEGCRRHGAADLFLAHHRGDQAETVLMRLAKGSGIEGLAGIPHESRREGIRLLRPFLSVAKQRLIATCADANIAYVTDPSNASSKYARGRLRQVLPLLASEGLTEESLVKLAERAGEVKAALSLCVRDLMRDAAQVGAGGALVFDRAALREASLALARRALAQGLRCVHPDLYPPEDAALSALLAAVRADKESHVQTLYGCLASVSPQRVLLLREPAAAAALPPLALPAGTTVVWDDRWRITAGAQAEPLWIRALGATPHVVLDRLAPDLRSRIPQGRVRASLPGLWDQTGLRAIPSFGEGGLYNAVWQNSPFLDAEK